MTHDSQWTIKGFNDRFDELIKEKDTYNSYLKAYFKAEEEHYILFKKYRYKNYESFRYSRRLLIFKMKQ